MAKNSKKQRSKVKKTKAPKVVAAKIKAPKCSGCPALRGGKIENVGFEVYPAVKGAKPVLFLLRDPGRAALRDGKFCGESEDYLKDLVKKQNGGTLKGCAFGYMAKCQYSGKNKQALTHCYSAYAEKEIAKIDPSVIVPMGKEAVEFFFPNRRGLYGQTLENGNITYVPAFHPWFALNKANNEGDEEPEQKLARAITTALRCAGAVDTKPTNNKKFGAKAIYIQTIGQLQKLKKKILNLPEGAMCCVDTEGDNLNRMKNNRLISVQFCMDGKNAYVLPVKHPKTPFTGRNLRKVLKILAEIFVCRKTQAGKAIKKFYWLFHNAVFDLHMLEREIGVGATNNPILDTMALAYIENENRIRSSGDPKHLYYPEQERGLSLGLLTKIYLGEEYAYDEADKAERSRIIRWKIERFVNYAAKDAWVPWRIAREMFNRAEKIGYGQKMLKLAEYLYSPGIRATVRMERNGMCVDLPHLQRMQGIKSPMLAEMKKLKDKLCSFQAVKDLNSVLLTEKGRGSKLWIGGKPWLVDMKKGDHMRRLFFDTMRMDPISWTSPKTGQPVPQVNNEFYKAYGSWDDETNEPQNIAAVVCDWSALQKLMSAFMNSWYKIVHPDYGHDDMRYDQNIRGLYRLLNTVTGRLAHQKPNLGQLPKATNAWRKMVKDAFIAMEGYVILATDLSANEVRCVVNDAGEKALGRIFKKGNEMRDRFRAFINNLKGKNKKKARRYLVLKKSAEYVGKKNKPDNKAAKQLNALLKSTKLCQLIDELYKAASLMGDIHKQTAAAAFIVAVEKVTKMQRQAAKAIVFGILYGSSVKSVAVKIGRTLAETQKIFDDFFVKFPGLKKFVERCHRHARSKGYVESPIGRRRRFNKKIFKEGEQWLQARALRQSQNSPTQGLGSDVCVIACGLFERWCETEEGKKCGAKLISTVHDAVYAYGKAEHAQTVLMKMRWCLTTGAMQYMTKHFGVVFLAPLESDGEIGMSLGSLHDCGVGSDVEISIAIDKAMDDHKTRYGYNPIERKAA